MKLEFRKIVKHQTW